MLISVDLDKKECMSLTIEMRSGKVIANKDIPDMPFGVSNFVQYWDDDTTELIYVPLSDVKCLRMKLSPKKKK